MDLANQTKSQSTSRSTCGPQLELRCSLWVHDEQFSKQEVICNLDILPQSAIKTNDLLSISSLKSDTGVRDFQQLNPAVGKGNHGAVSELQQHSEATPPSSTSGRQSHDVSLEKRYLFAAKDMDSDMRAKHPTLEISVTKHIADAFGFKHRSNVLLTTTDASRATASHVELSFKDEYLSRADMWRLTMSELSNKTLYKNQKILFLGTIKATVSTVYCAGRKSHSAFFASSTRPIFRSESSRFVLCIQMSREMWDFDSEGSGEIMFTKVVDGFLPALFKRWAALKARHLVSVVLFTRVEYDMSDSNGFGTKTFDDAYHTGTQCMGQNRPFKDFYRVVVSEMASGEWTTILYQLKREFRFFRHDISMFRLNTFSKTSDSDHEYKGMGSMPGTRIEAEPSLAIHGNILEAINLTTSHFSHDYIDRDLVRTGISVVLITPGSGLFEVDYQTLRTTTEALVSTGIGIDLVCLPKAPLHSVPLFRYKNPRADAAEEERHDIDTESLRSTAHRTYPTFDNLATVHESTSASTGKDSDFGDILKMASPVSPGTISDRWSYAIPHWMEVSFWTGASEQLFSQLDALTPAVPKHASVATSSKPFDVRCRMYELAMLGGSEARSREVTVAPMGIGLSSESKGKPSKQPCVDGYTVIEPTRRQSGLAEALHYWKVNGRVRNLDRRLDEGLSNYDEGQSLASTHPHVLPFGRHVQKNSQIADERTIKDKAMGDTSSDAASFRSTGTGSEALQLTMAAPSNAIQKNRKDSTASTTSIPMRVTPGTVSKPRITRQISLGPRGFGVAAPKAAVTELQTQHANVATVLKGVTGKAIQESSSVSVASHLLSSRADKMNERPESPQSSRQSSKGSEGSPDSKSTKGREEKIKPIAIKQPVAAQGSSMHSRSILGSVYESTSVDKPAILTISEKLKSSDSLRASKAKLFSRAIPAKVASLSPATALAPWLNVLNPSNPIDHEDAASQYKRWQHVFPQPLRMNAMRWKSLCSPASVPLTTEYFPTKTQLQLEYEQKPYSVSLFADDDAQAVLRSRNEFLCELISSRLSQGFQLVVGQAVADAFGQKAMKLVDPFCHDIISEDGASVFMSMGNVIHQLSCVNDTEIEVNVFSRKVGTHDFPKDAIYKPAIMTTLAPSYETKLVTMHQLCQPEHNWNFADSFVAGHDEEMSEGLRFWRARFVLIPLEHQNSHSHRKGEDTPEETRLEGIKTLTQIWQKHRVIPQSERLQHNVARHLTKDPNPLDIVYQTSDPSVVVTAELENLLLTDTSDHNSRRRKLLSDVEPFRRAALNVAALAEAIQAPTDKGGIRMQNRRWHLKLYYNCFIGSDMTTWLLENFEDIESRSEAVELGNLLMSKSEEKLSREHTTAEKEKDDAKDLDLFVHVRERHPFRDGQYFYQVIGEHAKQRSENRGGWPFTSRRRDNSVPSTPMTENPSKESPRQERLQSSSEKHGNSEPEAATPSAKISRSPKIALSKVMKYDVDPRKRSYRAEHINLHYDRLHNPDNCYHIRINWVNVTAKLIEDAIQSWATSAERYGLRLIEVPVAEATSITDLRPFRSPYLVKLATPPPEQQPATFLDAISLVPQVSKTRHFYQKAIMRHHQFVLDIESKHNFPSNIDVTYSWGRPDYHYTQYIHRSGVLLAQITDDGNFILLANKLYNNRAIATKEAERHMRMEHNVERGSTMASKSGRAVSRSMASAMVYGTDHASQTPVSSPMLRATLGSPVVRASSDVVPPAMSASKPSSLITPESIKNDLEALCHSESRLEAFYREMLDRAVQPVATTPVMLAVPPSHSLTAQRTAMLSTHGSIVSDANIPTLGLPPGLLSRDVDRAGSGSPAHMRLTTMIGNGNGPLPLRRSSGHVSDAGSATDSPRSSVAEL